MNDTMSHFEQAVENVEAWVRTGHGQAGYEWQLQSLTNMSSHTDAAQLTEWWSTHPANTAK